MSTGTRNAAAWVGAGLVAIGMAGGMALFAARSAAATEVRPLDTRVTTLEAQRVEDKEQRLRVEGELKSLNGKLDKVLEEVRKR